VLEEARRLGYVPDAAARRLKSHPLWRIGLLFSPFRGPNREINPAALATIDALRQNTERRRLAFSVIDFTDNAELETRCAEHEVDAVVTYGHFETSTFDLLARRSMPTVSLQGPSIDASGHRVAVRVDTRAAAYQATQYLAALGHREVGLVAGPDTELHHRGFHEGFAAAVAEFGLHAPEAWRLSLPPDKINADGSAHALRPLLAGGQRPSAMLFASDWLAAGGLRAALDAGLTVPDDLSLVGFDNLPMAAGLKPALTTFDVHLDLLADSVLEAVTGLLASPGTTPDETTGIRRVCADMVKRDSCALARR
ncbi:MAG: LacI family DNA-binding transcriptional regulator, partial [Verrucomicrobiota bacterium]